MSTEAFVASILRPETIPPNLPNKDVGIFTHEYLPSSGLKTLFKKSSTKPNCLAISSTHVYAVQADKAVVHVYNLSKGNQEFVVPFTERLTSCSLVGNADILALGTEKGRLILWEVL
jgi:pre-rRNA-processing protein IPI3